MKMMNNWYIFNTPKPKSSSSSGKTTTQKTTEHKIPHFKVPTFLGVSFDGNSYNKSIDREFQSNATSKYLESIKYCDNH